MGGARSPTAPVPRPLPCTHGSAVPVDRPARSSTGRKPSPSLAVKAPDKPAPAARATMACSAMKEPGVSNTQHAQVFTRSYTCGMLSDAAPLDPSCCPRCGQANQCALAAGLPAESCWCMQASIAPHALQGLPDQAAQQACICPDCGRALPDSGTTLNGSSFCTLHTVCV